MEPSFTPTQIGPFEILSVIGRGRLGTVYKATDTRAGRSVAIKALTVATDDPDLFLLKFYRENKNIPKLQHENIAVVLELGYGNGAPYVVTEYLEGESLDAVVASRRPLPLCDKLNIVLQVCAGLNYAHTQNLLHRDIRPSHIFIAEDGRAKIIDFGMARLRGNPTSESGKIPTRLSYLSPEQMTGTGDLDVRTDVYSIGVILFQLLTGVVPSEGETSEALLKKVAQGPLPSLGKYIEDCPPDLELITRKALATDREARYSSTEDLAIDLARVQQQCERQMLAAYLHRTEELILEGNFTSASEEVRELLRRAPQSAEAHELVQRIEEGREKQQRAEQMRQVQMRAEDAFRRNQFAEALHFVEEALQIDPDATVLLRLRDSVLVANEKQANYRKAVQRAELALQSNDLQTANDSINQALAILPEDPQGKKLASQIRSRVQQQLREQEIQERKRKLASDIQVVEKAIAEARALLSNGQADEALQALEGARAEFAQLPPQWAQEASTLEQEILRKQREFTNPVAQANFPANPTNREESQAPLDGWVDKSFAQEPSRAPGNELKASAQQYPRSWLEEVIESEPVAQPARPVIGKDRSAYRSVIWISIAAVILMGTILWLIFRPKPVPYSSPAAARPVAAAAGPAYAEINAIPWAIITDISPKRGEAQSALGRSTPLRISVPAGKYTVTFEGPNHERKQATITVPSQGSALCYVSFGTPDLGRIVGQ
jgi:Arc/MetJ-type ribon-helix-helix transcriptional regulator/predicted Ser/Thr protein kinase